MRLLLLAGLVSLTARADAVLVDRIVAVVDLHAITRSAVDERVRSLPPAGSEAKRTQARRAALTELIEDALIAKDAARLKLEVTEEDVDRALAEVARQNKVSLAELEAETKRQGLGGDRYRSMLRRKLLELKWLNLAMNREAQPAGEAERGAFIAAERARLVEALKASSVVEVRP